MLILPQNIETSWNTKNKKYYESLGYLYTKFGHKFNVNVLHLPEKSKNKVRFICDYCGIEKITQFKYVNPNKR